MHTHAHTRPGRPTGANNSCSTYTRAASHRVTPTPASASCSSIPPAFSTEPIECACLPNCVRTSPRWRPPPRSTTSPSSEWFVASTRCTSTASSSRRSTSNIALCTSARRSRERWRISGWTVYQHCPSAVSDYAICAVHIPNTVQTIFVLDG